MFPLKLHPSSTPAMNKSILERVKKILTSNRYAPSSIPWLEHIWINEEIGHIIDLGSCDNGSWLISLTALGRTEYYWDENKLKERFKERPKFEKIR